MRLRGCALFITSLFYLIASPGAWPYHPADGDNNWEISLPELTAYAQAWAEESVWPSGPSPVTEEYFSQAQFIWEQGERYREITEAPLPQAWVPDPLDATLFLAPEEMNPEPLDIVRLIGLPPDQTNLFAEFRKPGELDRSISFIVPLEESDYGVVVPFFPGEPGGAARFDMIVFSDEGEYPVGPMLPEPLPPAPGTGLAASAALKSIMDDTGSLFNQDLTGLVDVPFDQIPDELKIPAMLDQVVQDPNNPNNLGNVLNGTAPLLDEYEVDPAVMDSLLAKLGIEEQIDSYQELVSSFAQAQRSRVKSGYYNLETDSLILEFDDLSDLADSMQFQCDANSKANPGPKATAARDAAAASASFLAVGGGPLGAVAATSFNTTLWALDTASQAVASQWPSDISDFEIELSHEFFLEDKCETGTWTATMKATSTGWSVDKAAISGALNVLGAKGLTKAGKAASDAAREGFSVAQNTVVDVSSEIGVFAFGKAYPGDKGLINVPPSEWTGIPVTEDDLGILEITFEGSSVKEAGKFKYTPDTEAGQTILRVLTQDGALGDCDAQQGGAVIIEVKENKVSLSPLGGEISPEETRTFTASVTDAENKKVDFIVSHGDIVKQEQIPGTDEYELTYKAPPKVFMPDEIKITAISAADTCIRAFVTRQRETILSRRKNNFVLDPNVTCVQIGSTVDFEVINTEDDEVPNVTWEHEGVGSLSPSGEKATYSASQTGGPVVVRAIVQIEPLKTQTLEQTFDVGDCLAVGLSFSMPQETGIFTDDRGFLSITDVPKANMADPTATEQYQIGIRGEITSIGDGTVQGNLDGHAMTLKFPEDYDPSEDGSETFTTTSNNFTYELTVVSRVGLDQFDPETPAVSYEAPGRIRVNFITNASMSGNWPMGIDISFTNWTWQFSDGATLVGERVSHVFDMVPPYDKWVVLTVTNGAGHTVSYKQQLRFVDFSVDFSGPYPGSCFAGFGGNCPGEIILFGPHPGSLDTQIWSAVPNPQEPGTHVISINY